MRFHSRPGVTGSGHSTGLHAQVLVPRCRSAGFLHRVGGDEEGFHGSTKSLGEQGASRAGAQEHSHQHGGAVSGVCRVLPHSRHLPGDVNGDEADSSVHCGVCRWTGAVSNRLRHQSAVPRLWYASELRFHGVCAGQGDLLTAHQGASWWLLTCIVTFVFFRLCG